MDKNQLFKKYYDRLAKEGLLKAMICGLIVGFSASLVSGFMTFLLIYGGLWAALISWALGFAIGTVFFYYKKFRPTTKMVAERVDRLGLEERVITMLSLENDQSYIAMRQREDALERLSRTNSKSIKIAVFKMPIIIMGVIALLATSMVTISELSASGRIGWTPVPDGDRDKQYVISYSVSEEGGGFLYGDLQQVVLHGEDGGFVIAIPDDGYMFSEWSDGLQDAERFEPTVMENIEMVAFFEKLDLQPGNDDSETDDGGEGPEEETGEPPVPAEPQDETGGKEPPEIIEGDPNVEGGGTYNPNNQIIDGQTYYREEFYEFLRLCTDRLENGEELTEAQKAFIKLYFGILV